MAVEWHYSREGKRLGPVSSAELQALAHKGLLAPDDLVWKEGMEGWQKAGRLKGLFPVAAAAPPPMPAVKAATTAPSAKQGIAVLGASAKVAGELALKQAEKTKIQTLSLPRAFASLGKAVYDLGAPHPDTAAIFATIGDLSKQLADVRATDAPSPETRTLGDKAITLGKQASAAVSAKSLESRLQQQYAQLGALTYERADLPHHQHAEAEGIRTLQDREKELSRQISALGEQMGAQGEQIQEMAKATVKKGYSLLLTTATVVTFPMAPVSWLPIWKHPAWNRKRKTLLSIASVLCTVGLIAFVHVNKAAAEKAIGVANGLWDSGDQAEAIRQYRHILPLSVFLASDSQAMMFGRIIDFDAKHEQLQSVRSLVEQADRRDLVVTITEPKAKSILAEYQEDKRRKLAEEEQRREKARESKESQASGAPFGDGPSSAYKEGISKGMKLGRVHRGTGNHSLIFETHNTLNVRAEHFARSGSAADADYAKGMADGYAAGAAGL